MRLKKVLSYLELEGQGWGIIIEVTCPLLLGPFYLVKWPVNPNILAASVRQKIGQEGVLSNPYTPMNLASMIELKMA